MVKTSDFESENSGSSPAEAANRYETADERAALRVLAIIAAHNLSISSERATELASSIVAEISPDVEWNDIERLASGNYTLCDGYCRSDDW